jgi:hypothetical protein
MKNTSKWEEKHAWWDMKTILKEIHRAYFRSHMRKGRYCSWGKIKIASEVRLRWHCRKSEALLFGIVKIIPESVWIPYLRTAEGLIRRQGEPRILGKVHSISSEKWGRYLRKMKSMKKEIGKTHLTKCDDPVWWNERPPEEWWRQNLRKDYKHR